MTKDKDKKPEGGYDSTPLHPNSGPTYTVRFVFHSARDLPIADLAQASSDPYVLAQLNCASEHGRYGARHSKDPYLRFRSATAYSTLNPTWDAEWVVAGIPANGGEMIVRIYDEDNGTQDDRLGATKFHLGHLSEDWKMERTKMELKQRGGSVRAVVLDALLGPCVRGSTEDSTLTMSAEVLGVTEDNCGKAYTMNSFWWIHYSPLMGAMVGTTAVHEGREKANFQANQLQLRGPVPNELYHRYVDFSPFVHVMFERTGLRGYIMHSVLHAQHEKVYHFDSLTEYGVLPGPGKQMAQRFLDMCAWGEGYRIFTYIITLDGLMRFTETGKEFAVDMLSKHTMHSDVNIYIAISGEFFVRKWKGDRGRGTQQGIGEEQPGIEGSEGNGTAGDVEDSNEKSAQRSAPEPNAKSGKIDYSAPSHSMLSPPKDADTASAQLEEHRHDHHLVSVEDEDADGAVSVPANAAAERGVPPSIENGENGRETGSKASSRRNFWTGKPENNNPSRKANKNFWTGKPENNGRPVQYTHIHGGEHGESTDPARYELVIDNDSGTYRPNKDVLPLLAAFLQSNFVGLHVTAKACQDDAYQKVKEDRRKEKDKRNKGRVFASSASDLSSIASDSDHENGGVYRGTKEKGMDFISNPKGTLGGFMHKHRPRKGEKGGEGGESGEINEKQ